MKLMYMSGYASLAGEVELDAPLLLKPFTTKELMGMVREILDAP
jgi:hypothetical protein